MKMRPLHDRVIIRRMEEERTSAGGIVIPDTAAEKPIRGEVVAVGPGKLMEDGKLRPLDVKPGNKVLFGKYSGTEIKIEGEELLVMREDDIIALIEGKSPEAFKIGDSAYDYNTRKSTWLLKRYDSAKMRAGACFQG